MAAGGDFYQALLRRCQNLEASHARLSEKLRDLQRRHLMPPNDNDDVDGDDSPFLRGFSLRSPYRSALESLGHALHVFRASSGEIVYWNRSAENLYGWRGYEVVGRRCFTDLLVPEEQYVPSQNITSRLLRTGEPWSGQFPLKKRSGKVFMALVTKSLLYENGQLAGVIVVSSDAAVVNGVEANNPRPNRDVHNNSQRREQGSSFKKIKWHPRPPVAPGPEIAASVSNLAAKVLAKLQIKGKKANEDDARNRKSGDNYPVRKESSSEPSAVGNSRKSTEDIIGNKRGRSGPSVSEASECNDRSGSSKSDNASQKLFGHKNEKEAEDEALRQGKQFSSSEGSIGDQESRTEGENESNSLVDCEIHWEDLHMGEEIGQGFYAIVYRGIWNGSDVAIKLYLKNEYSEGTLQDYKKEIDIMKRLRHPNVLLFMGAAYSQERLAIITEFMPRGSLFKTLHKNNQTLDIRRRVRMALDVARGMNYLHRRNPPIVHRDLKSSNLLVDKNWTVKVGDFGLSKLKNATFLTAKSGRGTPQWMAPEILRNEPSNEKSDVYSFGVILWELMTESIPWNNLNPLQVVGIVGFMDRRLDLPEKVEPQIASIIRDCWKSDPAQRPSFEDIIQSMSNLNPRLAPVTTQKSAGI